jgi:hypothetical protein
MLRGMKIIGKGQRSPSRKRAVLLQFQFYLKFSRNTSNRNLDFQMDNFLTQRLNEPPESSPGLSVDTLGFGRTKHSAP